MIRFEDEMSERGIRLEFFERERKTERKKQERSHSHATEEVREEPERCRCISQGQWQLA